MPDEKERGMGKGRRRTWIKLHCYGRLHGSMAYQLQPDERSTFDELLCFAGICGLDGTIADNDGRPYPHSFIAHELHITLELLERTLKKCIAEGRITEDENGIHITHWNTYQSEYERQKPYREAKKGGKPKKYWYCPDCHYTLEKTRMTARMELCPVCMKKDKEVEMIVRSK